MPLKDDFIRVCHKVYEKGFVSAYDGNISAVTPDNTFLITRSGVNKGDIVITAPFRVLSRTLQTDDLIEIKEDKGEKHAD